MCIFCFTRRERQTREMTPPLPQTTRNACMQGSSPRWSTVLNVVKCATVSLAATCFMTSAAKCRFAFALATLHSVGMWKWQAGSTYHTGTRPIVERSLFGSLQSGRTAEKRKPSDGLTDQGDAYLIGSTSTSSCSNRRSDMAMAGTTRCMVGLKIPTPSKWWYITQNGMTTPILLRLDNVCRNRLVPAFEHDRQS